LHPNTQDVLDAVHVHAHGDVGAVAHVDHQGVEVADRIKRFQGPALPGQRLVADLVGENVPSRSRGIDRSTSPT
jgi:hypothetical protein